MKNKKLKTDRVPDLQSLLEKISKKEGMEEQRGPRRRSVVGAKKVFCHLAVRRMGYSGEGVAGFLGSRLPWSIGMPVLGNWVIWINSYKLRLNLRPLYTQSASHEAPYILSYFILASHPPFSYTGLTQKRVLINNYQL